MKRVLILNGESTNTENYAIRDVLENFGYMVTMFNIGRPQDYFDALNEKINIDYDYLIIGCHGDDGKIIVPVLGNNIFLAPYDYIDGKSDLVFVINLFYYLSSNYSLEDSYNFASKIDEETKIYKFYK